eukprot:gene36049-44459_t
MSSSSKLPEVDKTSLPLYDSKTDSCWGLVDIKNVMKEEVQEAALEDKFPTHKLEVRLSLRDKENYELIVSSLKNGDAQQVAKHSLAHCSVSVVDSQVFELYHDEQQSRSQPLIAWTGANEALLQWKDALNAIIENAEVAQITPQLVEMYASSLAKGSPVSIWSHSTETATAWKDTLLKVTAVATERDKMLRGVYTKKAFERLVSAGQADFSDSHDNHTDIDSVLRPSVGDWHLGGEQDRDEKLKMLI